MLSKRVRDSQNYNHDFWSFAQGVLHHTKHTRGWGRGNKNSYSFAPTPSYSGVEDSEYFLALLPTVLLHSYLSEKYLSTLKDSKRDVPHRDHKWATPGCPLSLISTRMPERKAGQGEDLPRLPMQIAFSLEIIFARAEDKGHHYLF